MCLCLVTLPFRSRTETKEIQLLIFPELSFLFVLDILPEVVTHFKFSEKNNTKIIIFLKFIISLIIAKKLKGLILLKNTVDIGQFEIFFKIKKNNISINLILKS